MGDPRLHLHVLGPIGAVRDGVAVDLGGPRQRRLVAALAVDCGRTVPLERLAERVWPDSPPEKPGRALRTGVARLRRALGDEVILTDGRGYRLVAAAVTLDSDRFTDAVTAAGTAEGLRSQQAIDALETALGWWAGEAYAEVGSDDWAQPEVERLNELRAVAVERRFNLLLSAGRHTDVIAPLAAAIETYPLRDRLVGLQMLAYYRCGRQAEAARAFQLYRRRLIDEVGLEPGPELVALERRILARDPDLNDPDDAAAEARALRGYVLGEQVGEGAFALVFKGAQPSVGREVAVKVIRAELANRPEFIRRFEAEAHLVARLEHPHIVPLYDYWREPGGAYLVFRYLRGGTLESRVAEGGLALEVCRTLVSEIGAALSVAHRAGVVHRDVKPANVFCDDGGHFYLGDFGIALDAAETSDPTAALSAGSPAYASPEQLRREPVGAPADVYGLAISLYEALTGRLPFPDASTNAELLHRQLHDPIPAVRSQRSDIPAALDAVMARATAKAPADRFQTVEEFVAAFETAVNPANGALIGTARRAAATALSADEPRNPYKGLRAFGEADAADFHGRARLVDRLVANLSRPDTSGRLAVVVGPSGIGKSSVVRAGLLPALRRGAVVGSERWFITTMQPGHDPFEELAAALLRVATSAPENLVKLLTEDHRGLARTTKALVPDGGELALVIDQFEELFTLTADAEVRRRFLDVLEAAVTDSRCPFRLILTLRADFYDRPLRHGSFARLIEPATVAFTALAPDELEAAIVAPATGVGAEFEPGLVSEIVADVGDQPGALPLMQYALTELYERQVSGLLTRAAYRDLGGVAGALAARAESLLAGEPPAFVAAARRLAGRLVTLGEGVEDTRRRARRSELGDDQDTMAVIERFGAARLLFFDRDPATREPTIEVAHEELLRSWPRLRSWLEEDRDDLRVLRHLTDAAAAWHARGRDHAELYRGGRLDTALDWLGRHPGAASAIEAEFIGRAQADRLADRDRERRQVRRLRALLSAVAAVAAVALVAGGLAYTQQRRADRNADQAQANAERASANAANAELARGEADLGRLAAEAASRATTDRQVALLLAAEAHRREQSPLTYGALQRVLSTTGSYLGAFGTGRSFSGASWSTDGTVVGFGPDGVGRYDVTTGHELRWTELAIGHRRQAFGDGQSVSYPLAAAAHSGTVVAIAPDERLAQLVEPDGTTRELFTHPTPVVAVAVTPGGSVAATLDLNGEIRVFELPDGVLTRTIPGHPERTYAEQLLDGARFFSDRAPAGLAGLPTTTMSGGRLSFPSDSALLSLQGVSVRLWDWQTGERLREDGNSALVMSGVLAAPLATGVALNRDGTTFTWFDPQRVAVNRFGPDGPIAQFDVPTAAINWGTPKVVDVVNLDSGMWSLLNDGRVIHTTAAGQLVSETATGVRDPVSLAANAAGSRLVVVGRSGGVVLSTDGTQLIARAGSGGVADTFSLSPEATSIAVSSGNVYDMPARPLLDVTADGLLERAVEAPDLEAIYVEGGVLIANAPFAGAQIQVLDSTTLAHNVRLENNGSWQAVTASPDGRWLVVGEAGDVSVFDVQTGKRFATYKSGDASVPSLAVHADGSRVLATFSSREHVMLSMPDLAVVPSPPIGDGRLLAARWTHDGAWLLTVDGTRRVSVRDPDTFELVSVLDGSFMAQFFGRAPMYSVGGGERILGVINDAPALWDARTGAPIGGPFPMRGGISSAGLDGHDLMVSALGDHVVLWNIAIEQWPDIACRAAGRNLTRDEWSRHFGSEPYRPTCDQWPTA